MQKLQFKRYFPRDLSEFRRETLLVERRSEVEMCLTLCSNTQRVYILCYWVFLAPKVVIKTNDIAATTVVRSFNKLKIIDHLRWVTLQVCILLFLTFSLLYYLYVYSCCGWIHVYCQLPLAYLTCRHVYFFPFNSSYLYNDLIFFIGCIFFSSATSQRTFLHNLLFSFLL